MKKLITLYLAFFSAIATAQEIKCEGLRKISAPYPPYPLPEQVREYLPGTSYMHIFVEGYVVVEFTVEKTGYVSDVKVIESENKPIRDRTNISFDGFLEKSVVPVVSKWQFEAQAQPCIHKQKFSYFLSPNA
ncbi:energy transducer TonB [Microbulbifer hydrolyticus]|uniref:TonB C-terminal domain-containing protein n=1 Tax=Microbulbifer hydrolyticus TaxID=48074 RepID=A0A6P1TFY6_9GAMM|nr:energy transducer TonB [Microbulbifer hydrolyticus]MBB5212550.1 hypothetical protein [Microbulbifer hydrolyticus]QHQ40169.1 hypothetical protein GTQ55_15065 [Microbulbifer hydrolyticus]